MKNSDLFYSSVVKPYNTWSDPKMSYETLKIQNSMTNNPFFPNPTTPDMAVFSTAVAGYILQLAKAGTRDMNAVAAKNARRAELTDLCIQLGYSVSNIANGNLEALVSTSLPQEKNPACSGDSAN